MSSEGQESEKADDLSSARLSPIAFSHSEYQLHVIRIWAFGAVCFVE